MRKLSIAILLLSASPCSADWRYCLAQDAPGKRVYYTDPFETAHNVDRLERAFNAWLAEKRLGHSWGMCPRAFSPRGPSQHVQAALRYNQHIGLEPARVGWPTE